MCSQSFTGLGHSQAKALGYPDLPIAVVPHPFGIRSREEIYLIAEQCVDDIARLLCENQLAAATSQKAQRAGASRTKAPADLDDVNRFFQEHRWSDGLPIIPPTVERVERMLSGTTRGHHDVVASIAPAYAAATVEHIAINAVMAGCYPEYMPVLIAATEAVAVREFNLQSLQASTNPATVWLVVNGPIAARLGINGENNCLGPGSWANATLGRALKLILQNIGGALPGEMDRATHGHPGKYTQCCAENEAASPWQPLHVDRGYAATSSTVTVVNSLGTWNMNTHAKDADDLLKVIADTMAFPAGSDYVYGGAPWLVLSPEHAHILHREGLSKADIKRRLWEQSKMRASRLAAKDFGRTQDARRAELGELRPDTMLPISVSPGDISIIVAGGVGTHTIYVPVGNNSRSVSREIVV